MKLYRCDLCGRVFGQKTPHKCYAGCFRKHSLTFTEFDDADCEYVKKSEVDVKEKSFPNIPQGALILNEPLESKIEHLVNWEQARIDAAIAAMPIANKIVDGLYGATCESVLGSSKMHSIDFFVKECVGIADALIAELKKEK